MNRPPRLFFVFAAAAVGVAGTACLADTARADDTAFFESKIRPILVERCYECHSADKKQKGNLLLDTREGALKGGDTAPAIVPGDPSKSLLLKAIKWEDGNLQMPPKQKLSDSQIADLETWIKAGAPDPRTGARALTKIEKHLEDAKTHWSFLPVVDPKPASLDALVGEHALRQADKRTLIRRAYLDLIGVPPTYAEVTAFNADNDPGAFEKVIDRLLADARYGERWGRHWLDVARYADTGGYFGLPHAWTYRDYVIQSFNEDKPYDRFIQEQIAADQLDAASDPKTLAGLAFLTIGWQKDGKIDDDTLDNALDTIGRGLLGLTLSCARCHDHKLEPITTKDYYGLFAVLKSCQEPEVRPTIPQQETPEVKEYRAKNLELREKYAQNSIKEASDAAREARSRLGDYLVLAEESGWKSTSQNPRAVDLIKAKKLNIAVHNWVVASRAAWIEKHPEAFGPFLEFISKKRLEPQPELHPLVAAAFSTPADKAEEVARRYNELFSRADTAWRELAAERIAMPVTLTPEEIDSYLPSYYKFIDDLQPRFLARLDALEDELVLPDAELETLRQVLLTKGSPVRFPSKGMRGAGVISNQGGGVQQIWKLIEEHRGSPGRPMLFVDNPKPAKGYVYVRGNGGVRGPDAPRRFISVFRDLFPDDFPQDKSGRLELAQAITSPKNPLTARVIVNRVWAWHFGTPIVGSPSDFGFQGEKPTNQPLLDHLAAWFMNHGWSFKQLHKYLMLSAAYQREGFPVRPLELEPFRDAVLAVSGRLDTAQFGKPLKGGTDTRRTVYGHVDRQIQPSLYRSFDFPNPSFSAPQRSRSMLVPRALILMNSPLLAESAKALASSVARDCADDAARVTEVYRRVLQRAPGAAEAESAFAYMAAYPENDVVHPESQDWQYGSGEFDPETKQLKAFAPLTAFDGKAFKGTGVMLDAMGGAPGTAGNQSTVRRWVAPLDGELNINAELIHMDEKSDGVIARVLCSRHGLLGEWTAKKQSVCTDLTKVVVKKGDMLDFIVTGIGGKDAAAYLWSPSIVMPGSDMPAMPGMNRRWDARVDFANPKAPQKPFSALEALCHALLLSPEFAVLE
jgi:mono/diheme cytochrome c family protein